MSMKSKILTITEDLTKPFITYSNDCITPDICEANRQEINHKIKVLGDLVASNTNDINNLDKHLSVFINGIKNNLEEIEDQINATDFNNMFVQQHIQLEILMMIRDNEIITSFVYKYLQLPCLTRIFNKKKVMALYDDVNKSITNKYQTQIDVLHKMIAQTKQQMGEAND